MRETNEDSKRQNGTRTKKNQKKKLKKKPEKNPFALTRVGDEFEIRVRLIFDEGLIDEVRHFRVVRVLGEFARHQRLEFRLGHRINRPRMVEADRGVRGEGREVSQRRVTSVSWL